jgi:hypothetical protein
MKPKEPSKNEKIYENKSMAKFISNMRKMNLFNKEAYKPF